MTDDSVDVDVVVVGGGMSGLTVAASLAERGRAVAVAEAADDVGGSAALSEGYVWTAPSHEVFAEQDPDGDDRRFLRMLDGLDSGFAWLESIGVAVGPRLTSVLGFGEGRQIDVGALIERTVATVERSGGFVLRAAPVRGLVVESGRVVGVTLADGEGGDATIRAGAVVIATGGFQAGQQLRAELMGEWAGQLILRSNAYSRGDGIRMARAIGADLAGPHDGFYGHLVPSGLDRFEQRDYAALALYFSEHGILLDRSGRRFADESLGDHVNAEAVARLGRALLVIDERIRRTEVVRPFIAGMDAVDKMAVAGARGALYASAPTLEALADRASEWGFPREEVIRSVESFSAAIALDGETDPPRRGSRSPIAESPYAAIVVEAAITFTYRGLASDLAGRVLRDGRPMPGLYVAGADLGGLNARGYTGGLVRGLTLGRELALEIDNELHEWRKS